MSHPSHLQFLPAEDADQFEDFFEEQPEYSDIATMVPEGMEEDMGWAELAAEGIDYYEALRLTDETVVDFSDEEIDVALENFFENMSPEDVENFWRSVQKAAKGVAGLASKAVQPLAQVAGGVVGGIVGGPVGAGLGQHIGGALGGMASQGLAQFSTSPTRTRPKRRRPSRGRGRRPARRPTRRLGRQIVTRAQRVGRAVGPVIQRQATRGLNHLSHVMAKPAVQQAVGQAAMGISGQIMNAAGQALSSREIMESVVLIADIEANWADGVDTWDSAETASGLTAEAFLGWAELV